MINSFGLLLLAVFGCWAIARINRSTRIFGVLMLSLALGYVIGATVSKLCKPLEKADNKVTLNVNYNNDGDTIPMAWVVETPLAWTAITSCSSVSSKEISHPSVIVKSTSPRVKIAHLLPRCLSPPMFLEKFLRNTSYMNSS